MNTLEICTGAYEENCLLAWGSGDSAVVIDPGDDPDLILEALADRQLSIDAILLTHGHIDHISALDRLLAANPSAPVYINSGDAGWAFSFANRLPGYPVVPKKPADLRDAADGDTISAAGLSLKVIHTPGHSPGSACFYSEDDGVLFAGDTLFAGSVGRTDFPGGSPAAQRESLSRLMRLPSETVVYTGHGPSTTIGTERATNPFIA